MDRQEPPTGIMRLMGNVMNSIGILSFVALAATMSITPPVIADEPEARAILVLDASGSMWGQVDDRPKILIARDVIQGLMDDWNPDVALGVTA
jgi:Ca-activated chloride channel family protein